MAILYEQFSSPLMMNKHLTNSGFLYFTSVLLPRLLLRLHILHPQGLTKVSSYVQDCPRSLQCREISACGTFSMALNHTRIACFFL